MHRSILALAACVGLAVAQNSTVAFFWPSAATWEVPAITVQSVNASATVMQIGCPKKQKSSCEWGAMNYTIFDQSTYEATMTNASYSITRTCVAKETPSVKCYYEGYDRAQVAAFAGTELLFADAYNDVVATIDAGVELLAAATAASGSGPSPAAGSSATATASSTSTPQATGAAGAIRAELAIVVLGAAAAAVYV